MLPNHAYAGGAGDASVVYAMSRGWPALASVSGRIMCCKSFECALLMKSEINSCWRTNNTLSERANIAENEGNERNNTG